MNKIISSFFIFLFISCAKTPSAKDPSVRKDLLVKPNLLLNQNLPMTGDYGPGSLYLTMFLWPRDISREELKVVSNRLAETGAKMDRNLTKQYPIGNSMASLNFKIEVLEEKYEEEKYNVISLFSNDGEIPDECDEYDDEPWNNPDLAQKCGEEYQLVEEKYEPMIDALYEEYEIVEEEAMRLSTEFSYLLGSFEPVLEEDPDRSETFKNWIKCKAAGNKFVFPKGSFLPKIQLFIEFNNLINKDIPNKALAYSSNSTSNNPIPDIVDVKVEMVNLIPTLFFKLFEKRLISSNKSQRTGIYYKFSLRRTELPFGLRFQGDIEKYDKSGISQGKGMSTIYFPISTNL